MSGICKQSMLCILRASGLVWPLVVLGRFGPPFTPKLLGVVINVQVEKEIK